MIYIVFDAVVQFSREDWLILVYSRVWPGWLISGRLRFISSLAQWFGVKLLKSMNINYDRLKPSTDIEYCECNALSGILLVDLLTPNPVHCAECRKEIRLEDSKLSQKQIDKIANWYRVANSLYLLWLDSGEYETYAKARLLDKKGQVNIEGMKLAEELSRLYPTLYWWFWDTDDGEPDRCPNCGGSLDGNVKYGSGKCERCKVII